jgi:predicted permease
VTSASLIENVPMSGWQSGRSITVDGEKHRGTMNAGGPGLFETLGVDVVAGRDLGPQDRAGTPQVVVVNERAAREWFGGNAVGRRIDDLGPNGAEVVGVVADTKYTSVRSDLVPTFYDPYAQRSNHSRMHVVVRAAVPAAALEPRIRETVASVDRLLPVTDYRSQTEEIGVALSRERVFTRLLVVFGIFALLLASVGLHGLTSFAVARRTNEIGIRLALGARRTHIVWLMLRQVIVLAAIGLAIGVPIAVLVAPVVEALLFGLAPGDPATIAVAATVMLAVALLAGWLPARRAAALEALHALRRD